MNKQRPVLKGLERENMTSVEAFQNNTLRPVIKMQHSLLIATFNRYIINKKVDFLSLTDPKKRERIKGVFTKDISFKNQTIGCIIGQFTTEEYHFYAINSSELNRRIIQIIIQRVQDSLAELA
ncbi:glyoxalase [Polaribacter tangerinus]|uniref:glyoxalase n=1 Tax=Polaribacter tangerinus TaxID=1920034 RepID=UPI000B4AC816|nr:glyoxalase [Polaribacter tangerinus]